MSNVEPCFTNSDVPLAETIMGFMEHRGIARTTDLSMEDMLSLAEVITQERHSSRGMPKRGYTVQSVLYEQDDGTQLRQDLVTNHNRIVEGEI